jgi:hypothetical protein
MVTPPRLWQRALLVASGVQLLACMFLADMLPFGGWDSPVWALPGFAAPYLFGIVVVAAGLVAGPRTHAAATWVARVVVIAVVVSNCVLTVLLFIFWTLPGLLIYAISLPLLIDAVRPDGQLPRGMAITAGIQCAACGLVLVVGNDPHVRLVLLASLGAFVASWRWHAATVATRRAGTRAALPAAVLAR